MAAIRPYTIAVPDSELSRLSKKLADSSLPDEIDEAGWDYGAPLEDVKRLAAYWKDKYNWRAEEAKLNKLPHYEASIEVDGFGTVEVHFIHQPSSAKTAIPLLFVHGWPGSFIEALKILPLLAESEKNGGPAFHVVVPSLPNFGFSSGVLKRGFKMDQYAETFHKLMLALGYEEYVTQGGDWGSMITRRMGLNYPSSVKACHVNFLPRRPPPFTSPFAFLKMVLSFALKLYSTSEMDGIERTQQYMKSGGAYMTLQSTKPQTLGYALADSPVALLAWIYEKLHLWTDGYPWTEDEVITWVSIYWFSTAGPAASVRIYYESIVEITGAEYMPTPKLGVSYFPKEIIRMPQAWSYHAGRVVFLNEHEKGGHFASWEQPEALVGDLRLMFSKGGPAYGAVQGRDGYS